MNLAQKLEILADAEGFDSVTSMVEDATDSCFSVPGICINEGCDYTTEVENTERRGRCEFCESPTVQSCLILAEVME